MENFEKIKEKIIKSAKENGACKPEFRRALESSTLKELCNVLKDNFNWGCSNNVITPDLINEFKDEFASCDIFINQDVSSGFLLAWGSATVEAWGSATVEAYGSATVEAWGSATVEAYGSATVEAYDSATVKAWGSATVFCRSTIECKISDKVIIRRTDINTIQYCDENMKFEKIEPYI